MQLTSGNNSRRNNEDGSDSVVIESVEEKLNMILHKRER